jgi:hypothetical protein
MTAPATGAICSREFMRAPSRPAEDVLLAWVLRRAPAPPARDDGDGMLRGLRGAVLQMQRPVRAEGAPRAAPTRAAEAAEDQRHGCRRPCGKRG